VKLPHRPLAVIFDMDGLIFDTETLYQEAIMAAADDIGQEMTPAIFRSMIGRPWLQTRRFLLEHYGSSFPSMSSGRRGIATSTSSWQPACS
jgi:beta-phosphoglucomutase-like phosphatase (HAD superfamily)